MEIFDNLDSVLDTAKNVIGTAANAIAEKTVEIKDASKTKYKIYELKSDIKKMYSAIGKLTYAQPGLMPTLRLNIRFLCAM